MERFKVRSYEADPNGFLRLGSLVNLLEEAASNNAETLGASVQVLLGKGISWVMYRMQLNIVRMPKLGEEILIDTWPSGIDKFFTYRDFRVKDLDGNVLAEATTNWIVLDMKARKMIQIPTFIIEMRFVPDREHLVRNTNKLKPATTFEFQKNISVLKGDLDQNMHVNNARYFQWLLEPLPAAFDARQPRYIDAMFKAEAYLHDEVVAKATRVNADELSMVIWREQDSTDLIHAQILY